MRRPPIRENLPLPYVEYPESFNGAFPGFRETPDSPVVFCECQRSAIFNRLDLFCPNISVYPKFESKLKMPDTKDFPEAFYQPLLKSGLHTDEEITAALKFLPNICHQCNKRVPCDQLRQRSKNPPPLFRFYYRKIQFDHGVELYGMVLEDRCSPQIRALIPYHPLLYRKVSDSWENHWKNRQEIISLWKQHAVPVQKFFSEEFCRAFDFPLQGPSLINETVLYWRTAAAVSPHKVLRHHRPNEFRGLSLDIFIPDLSVAIEYQGAQHFEAFDHLGGEKALKRTQERDERKARLCREAGIQLIYFEGDMAFVSEEEIRYEIMQRVGRQKKIDKDKAARKSTGGENHSIVKWQYRGDLPEDKAAEVDALERILNSVSDYPSQYAWAVAISKQHPGERGFSLASLQRLNLHWKRSNQDWRILVKYYSLWRDQGYLLKKHGLTPELIKVWLADKPGTYKSLAKQCGMNQTMVSLILSGKSTGLKAENLIREVAKHIFGNRALAQQKLAALLDKQRELDQQREKIFREVKKLKQKLEVK
jgi:hypothetical protein